MHRLVMQETRCFLALGNNRNFTQNIIHFQTNDDGTAALDHLGLNVLAQFCHSLAEIIDYTDSGPFIEKIQFHFHVSNFWTVSELNAV